MMAVSVKKETVFDEINKLANQYFGGERTIKLRNDIMDKLFRTVRKYDVDTQNDMIIVPAMAGRGNPVVSYDLFMDSLLKIFKDDKYKPDGTATFITYFISILQYGMKTYYEKLKKHNDISRLDEEISDGVSRGELIDSGETTEEVDVSVDVNMYVLLGEKLISEFDNYVKSKSCTKSEITYFSTFYSLDTCGAIRTDDVAAKAVVSSENQIRKALDFDLIHEIFIEYCEYLRNVVFANVRYELLDYVLSSGWFEDAIIAKIKKTRTGKPIDKGEVSKRRKKYKEVVGTIIKEGFLACI